MMEKIKYKNRERIRRGVLESFDNLPENVQKNFIEIKKYLIKYFGKEIDVYVHGSYKHGYWDVFSDYDVLINEKLTERIDNKIMKDIGINANIFSTDKKIGVILIP